MTITKDMCVTEENIIEQGLTVERFKEIMNAEDHTDEESDMYNEIIMGWAECHDSTEDLWTDRKGGYEIDYELVDDE